jgi:hypothetical protein
VVVHKSEAHRRIAELVAKHGPAWVERKLDLSDGTVRGWVVRGRVPQKRIRERVAERLGLAEVLWTTTPPGHIFAKRSQKRAIAPTVPLSAPTSEVEKGEVAHDPSDPKENAVATLRILRRALEKAESEQIPSLANAVTSSSRLLARLSGHLDVTEAQILRSAAWARLVKVVREVLGQHAGAAAQLDKALADYEARA